MKPPLRQSVSLVTDTGMSNKSAVFGWSSTLPPLGGGGGLVIKSVCKADLLSDHFDSKKSMESVDEPLVFHQSPILTKEDL